MNDDTQKLTASQTPQLDAGEETPKLQSGDELALAALSQAGSSSTMTTTSDDQDELAQSEQVAQTLTSLQNVIERNATELQRLAGELKEYRESLKNIFENDTQLAEAEQQAQVVTQQLKDRKTKLQADAQVTQLKVKIGEINEQRKEIEEALSNHLVNYYQLTNSTSFDTSDGDQWEFNIRAKVKPRKGKSSEE